jgi:hypothetical protein
MSMPVANNNGGAVLGVNGNYCAIAAWTPVAGQQAAANVTGIACALITNITYEMVNSTATGTLTFQSLGLDGTWRNMATPAAITLSSITINGTIAGAYHGVRVVLSALAVSTVTYFELRGTVVAF